jgi:phosphate transport system protein
VSLHLQRQIANLKKVILALGAQVEESVQRATRAIEQRDPDLAKQVIAGDAEIDRVEVELEEECLHTLALHQPVAFDIRYVVATLKINTELERIGDMAVNLAEQGLALGCYPRLEPPPFDLPGMSRIVRRMLKQSLDALVTIDAAVAERVREQDDEVDAIHRDVYQRIEQAIREDPELVTVYIHLLSISRNLERIADHAVNIAEDVIYMARGEVLRHQRPVS